MRCRTCFLNIAASGARSPRLVTEGSPRETDENILERRLGDFHVGDFYPSLYQYTKQFWDCILSICGVNLDHALHGRIVFDEGGNSGDGVDSSQLLDDLRVYISSFDVYGLTFHHGLLECCRRGEGDY